MRRVYPLIAIVVDFCLLNIVYAGARPGLGFTSTPEPTDTPEASPVPTDTPEPTYTLVPTDTPAPTAVTPTAPIVPSPTGQTRAEATLPPPATATPVPLLPQSGADVHWGSLLATGMLLITILVAFHVRRSAVTGHRK
jgi:hypothetical protein